MDNINIIASEEDKIREAASDAILIRSGRSISKPSEGAMDMRSMSLRDIAVECLYMRGNKYAHRLSDDDLFREAFSPDSQFSSILNNAVTKSMAIAYNSTKTTYQIWTGKGSNSNFRAATHYQISEAGELIKIPQGGEFKFDELIDSGVSKSLMTFGRSFGLSRQALINDDVGLITKVPDAYVRAAARGINKLVYRLLASNAVIYDGLPLFHANHNNIGADNSIGTASLSEARKAMRTQKNSRGMEVLNLAPRFLIVPSALETDAERLLISPADIEMRNPGVANVFRGSLIPISDPELDNYSQLAFYLAADPADIDTIEVTYLNGDEMPKVESRVSFGRLGMEWRIYIDYGVTILDYRGLFKNNGM